MSTDDPPSPVAARERLHATVGTARERLRATVARIALRARLGAAGLAGTLAGSLAWLGGFCPFCALGIPCPACALGAGPLVGGAVVGVLGALGISVPSALGVPAWLRRCDGDACSRDACSCDG